MKKFIETEQANEQHIKEGNNELVVDSTQYLSEMELLELTEAPDLTFWKGL